MIHLRIKTTIRLIILSGLLFSSAALAAFAQQSIPPEKRRAMHKFDPIDIFPEAQDRGRDKNRRNRKQSQETQVSSSVGTAPDGAAETEQTGRDKSLRKKSSPATAGATLEAAATPGPSPPAGASPTVKTSPTTSPLTSAGVSSSTLAATNARPDSSASLSGQAGVSSLWSLPVILGLFGLVLATLIGLVFALMKQLRKSDDLN